MKYIIPVLLFITLVTAVTPALARSRYRSATTTVVAPVATTSASEKIITAYVTGYSHFDNDPPGTAHTWIDGVGGQAGGTGTYDNPITMAVGFVGKNADFARGTKWYDPSLKAYFVAGDTCASCHNVPSTHASKGATAWVDMWTDGKGGVQANANKCMGNLTGVRKLIQNPVKTYAVTTGSLFTSAGCRI